MAPQVRVSSIGAVAARHLHPGTSGRVTARFARSAYIETDGAWICLDWTGGGRGPINILCGPGPLFSAGPGAAIIPGAGVRVDGAGIAIAGRLRVPTEGVPLWSPPPPETAAGLVCGLRIAVRHLRGRQFRHGLGGFIAGPATGGALPREALRAQGGIAALECWLAGCWHDGGEDRPPAEIGGLIGLGPGLTPSGDDYLCGAMVALHALDRPGPASRLYRRIAPMLEGATGPVSRALLATAAAGAGGEAAHLALNAILAGDGAGIPERIDRLGEIGHCSGWDWLAGAVSVLRVAAAAGGDAPLLPFQHDQDRRPRCPN